MPGSKRGLVAPQNTILDSIVNLVRRNNWQGKEWSLRLIFSSMLGNDVENFAAGRRLVQIQSAGLEKIILTAGFHTLKEYLNFEMFSLPTNASLALLSKQKSSWCFFCTKSQVNLTDELKTAKKFFFRCQLVKHNTTYAHVDNLLKNCTSFDVLSSLVTFHVPKVHIDFFKGH